MFKYQFSKIPCLMITPVKIPHRKIRWSALLVLTGVLLCPAWMSTAAAQQDRSPRRITKSFAEPVKQSIAASAEVGIIIEANVQEGDRVEVGDILARINQRVLIQSLAIAEARASSTARLDAATSQLELVKSQLEAIKSLVSGGHTNQYEVDQKKAEYQNAYAEFRSAQDEGKLNHLEVKRIRAQIEDRTIRSPIAGFVTEIHKQLGENISNNNPEYATIVQVDELKVRFYLEEETLTAIARGQYVRLFVGREKVPMTATAVYVSPIIDADSGLGRLDVRIDNREMRIKSGTICHWGGVDKTAVEKFTDQDVAAVPKSKPTDGPNAAFKKNGQFNVGQLRMPQDGRR